VVTLVIATIAGVCFEQALSWQAGAIFNKIASSQLLQRLPFVPRNDERHLTKIIFLAIN